MSRIRPSARAAKTPLAPRGSVTSERHVPSAQLGYERTGPPNCPTGASSPVAALSTAEHGAEVLISARSLIKMSQKADCLLLGGDVYHSTEHSFPGLLPACTAAVEELAGARVHQPALR
eukprot:COSAG04_NODE_9666_length_842_cov_1.010767_1_plen_118_part_10